MSIKVYVNTSNKRVETAALLDSGATENFIATHYANWLRLPIKQLPRARKVCNVDGTSNKQGDITHFTDLEVQTGTKRVKMRFFLTDLGEQKVILGYPWFAAMQPKVDWARAWLDYEQLPVVLRTPNAHKAIFVPAKDQLSRVKASFKNLTKKLRKIQSKDRMFVTRVYVEPQITSATHRQTQASKLAEKEQSTKKATPLPEHYQRHAHVFSEQEAQRFPGPRLWDHAIELKKDAPATLPGKIYALTQDEQKALQEFIKEHVQKGYIRPSKSPYAAPFFFIKKKDGRLRPVQDYRRLNEWTIRNRYPLPLISELISRVQGASLFSKFDIRWGYNNVRIKEGDEWKAAFITNQGLFEPRVMFFGLTNSPATFQTMMNAIFAEELRENWLTIYMDDILVHTSDDIAAHREKVHKVLQKLRQHDLYLKPEKCQFEQKKVEFLGVILEKETVQMDPTKTQGIADWKTPQNLKDVRAFLGFTGFYRYFVPNYSKIARPLIELTKKAVPFHWDEAQLKAFETLKSLMCSRPVLKQPDYTKPFFLSTDASAYGVGAVLSQEGETNPRTKKPTQQPIAYYSATFTPTERNYDIYERELLAVIKALTHWRPHLAATKDPVTILTDHANLTYWKTPRTINRRVARWFTELQDYNLVIKHVPGKIHAAADMLSRPPGVDKGEDDNTDVTLLPEPIFVRLADEPDPKWTSIEERVRQEQQRQPQLMKKWRDRYQLEFVKSAMEPSIRLWKHEGKMVFPPNDELKRDLLHLIHDKPTAAHVGRDWTTYTAKRVAWWPGMSKWVENYVKGCAKCQQNKTLTHRINPPPYKINVPPTAQPFEIVAMDLITQLPNSHGHDAILTIVDHGCTRAALFLPCTTNITGEGIAKLYLDNVYRWFGIPSKIISDRDPRFTSHFSTSLCQRLGISRNISTAYHPQTDGLSERKNQWVEQYLRFVTSASQDDWSDWLAIATAVHNNYPNATTRIAPIEVLLGYSPRITMELPYPPTTVQLIDDRTKKATEKRKQAKEALNEAARAAPPDSYQIGDKVWLEAKHLALPYQTPKLAPKRHGPFTITEKISPVAYRLQLPTTWTVHDVFHASLLTPYRETVEHGTNYTRPPPDLIEDAEEYEVETIVNHRHFGRKRQLQYLIKWKGYPDADNTWESADHVHAPALVQTYHRKNPLTPMEQDKRGRKKRKVSIRSLKSHLLEHFYITPTCLPPPRPTPLSTISSPPSPTTQYDQNSRPLPSPSSTPLPFHSLAHRLPNPSRPPLNARTSPSHLTPIPRRVKSYPASTTIATPSLHKAPSMLCRDIPSWTPAPSAPSPSASPIRPSAAPFNISKRNPRSSSSARSSPTFAQRCPASPTPSAQKGSKRTTADSPTSSSPTPTTLCAKRATLSWATAPSHLRSAPWARKATPSSNTTYTLPPPTSVIPLPSRSPCGSLTPSEASPPLTTRPWTWPAARTTGALQPRSLATTRRTPASLTSRPRFMRSTASCNSSRRRLVRVALASREPAPSTASEPYRLWILVAPPALTRTPRVSVSPVVGLHS